MQGHIGLFVMEEADGRISVQVFVDPAMGSKQFVNLKRVSGNKEARATYIDLDYDGNKSVVRAKMLPETDDKEKRPDGIVLGQGPVWFDKETKGEKSKAVG